MVITAPHVADSSAKLGFIVSVQSRETREARVIDGQAELGNEVALNNNRKKTLSGTKVAFLTRCYKAVCVRRR
jgi:hypothetical protein